MTTNTTQVVREVPPICVDETPVAPPPVLTWCFAYLWLRHHFFRRH